MRKQPALEIQRCARCGMHETAEPLDGNDPMAGNEDGQGVGAACLADRTRSRAKLAGQCAVGDRLARRDFHQSLPDAKLKRSASRLERQVESMRWITPVGCQLVCQTLDACVGHGGGLGRCRQEIQPSQHRAAEAGTQVAERGGENRVVRLGHRTILAAESTTPSEEGVAGPGRESYSAALAAALRAGSFSLMRADLPERSRR